MKIALIFFLTIICFSVQAQNNDTLVFFDDKVEIKEISNTSEVLSEKIKINLSTLKSGSKIYVEKIEAKTNEGLIAQIKSIVLKIK